MIIRTSIEYLSPRTIIVTTPFKQRKIVVPGDDDSYAIDFRSLSISPDPQAEKRVIVYWQDDSKTLVIDDYDSVIVEMPYQCRQLMLKVEV